MRRLHCVLPVSCLIATGCVQLVAFEQPIVGQPDVVDSPSNTATGLCDPEIAMGESVLCAHSCEIDAATGQSSCDDRVQLDGRRATFALAGLHEVEVTLTACAEEGAVLRVEAGNEASFALDGRQLEVVAAPEAQARPYTDEDHLPAEGCEERTYLFQSGRIGLSSSGQRLCSAHLLPVQGRWTAELGPGLRSLELCFRQASPGGLPEGEADRARSPRGAGEPGEPGEPGGAGGAGARTPTSAAAATSASRGRSAASSIPA